MKRPAQSPKGFVSAGIFFVAGLLTFPAAARPEPDIASFISAKRGQVKQTAEELGQQVPSEVWKMFDAAASTDWRSTSNLFNVIVKKYKPLEQQAATNRLAPEVWYAVQEVGGFCEMFTFGNPKFIRLFADDIFKVVPAGSVYFGGTDPGRFIITALSRSHQDGNPFFTITQNQLVATNYLKYVKRMYGKHLKLPGPDKVKEAFDEYVADASRRLKHDEDFPHEPKQIQPGEEVQTVDGRVRISGQTGVMAVNGLVAKVIVKANLTREFYIEESFALDWMYPHLSPAGPILKLNHTPLDTLPQESVLKDREYRLVLLQRLIGFKVLDETSISEVCTQTEQLNGEPKGFQGDRAFLRDHSARNTFAKLRSATGGLYAWRTTHAKSIAEKRRMAREAELAFKQAYLLSPNNPETVWRFTMFLIEQDRADEAQGLVISADKLNPGDPSTQNLVQYVRQVIDWKKRSQ